MAPLPRLTLYGRPGCHLCDSMLAALLALRGEFAFTVDGVNIDGDAALMEKYDEHVPVLTAGSVELCRHFLDVAAVRAHLAKFR